MYSGQCWLQEGGGGGEHKGAEINLRGQLPPYAPPPPNLPPRIFSTLAIEWEINRRATQQCNISPYFYGVYWPE